MNMLKTTLCYLEDRGCYLMLLRNKKDADPNAGKWVGVGGKFADGESADECLVREVREETGWELASWDFRGVVHFVNDLCPSEDMYLFTAKAPSEASLPECDEGTFAWVPIGEVPELNLWEGDRIFLEMLARGERDIDLTLVYHGDELVDVRNCATMRVTGNDAMKGGKMKIVTIEREYGAGGHTVGKAVADALGVEIYDKDIIRNAAKASGIEAEQLAAEEERLGGGTSFINHIIPIAYDVKDVVFEHERDIDLTLVYHGDELVDVRNCATMRVTGNDAMKGGKMKIVTIEREYGAGGHTVGKAVADALGVEIYDKDIIRNAAKASGIEAEQLAAEEERLGGGTSFINHIIPIAYDVKDVVFEHERDVILEFAKQGPCVLLGRGAGALLTDAGIECVRVFLHAPLEARLARAEELLGLTDHDDLVAAVRKIDKQRRSYFEYYTDHKWGDVHDYDLCLDFAALGADRCVDIICQVAQG